MDVGHAGIESDISDGTSHVLCGGARKIRPAGPEREAGKGGTGVTEDESASDAPAATPVQGRYSGFGWGIR
ncbi:hypothetical protein GCM10009828_033460 [Actinoplanes couchii]